MKFVTVAQAFDEIEPMSGRLKITHRLAELLKEATPEQAGIICLLSLGELHPPYIESQFNVADKTMVAVIAGVLKESESAVAAHIKKSGDAGLVIVSGSWKQTGRDLSITDVYERLNTIQDISGTGSQEDKVNALQDLILAVDPVSAKYIVRIVLGTMRLGFSDMTIIDSLSWMVAGDKSLSKEIEDAYSICADMSLIAKTLKAHGITAIKNMHIVLGVPIRPAGAERLPTAAAIVKKIGACVAQPKLDGFRLQIHLDHTGSKPRIHFFSRNLKDMSNMFPDLADALKHLKVKTLIAEGEAIGYDENTGSFLPFQETVKRKRKHGIEESAAEFPLKLFFFDILYLNGKSVFDKTHEQRTQLLRDLIKADPASPLQVTDEKKISTAHELEEYFLQMIEEGLEGVVVKRPDAQYQPGKRNFNWIKLKRQEGGHIEDTIDCVILGYYSGSGKRAGFGIGAFLVGVYNKKKDCFETVAKVGTGLSDEKWKELKKKCDKLHVATQPKNVECPKSLAPDVWVHPELVCVIRADEITRSPVHTAGKTKDHLGLALRFPRFIDYRVDKGPEDATTVDELTAMSKHQA